MLDSFFFLLKLQNVGLHFIIFFKTLFNSVRLSLVIVWGLFLGFYEEIPKLALAVFN